MKTEDIFQETPEIKINPYVETDFLRNVRKTGEKIENGYGDPLLFVAKLYEIIDTLSAEKDRIKDIAISEIQNSLQGNEKSYKKHGYQFSITQSGSYNYKNYDGYSCKEKELSEIAEKMKIAYKQGGTFIDPETGEVIPAAEYKTSKKGISIKKSK